MKKTLKWTQRELHDSLVNAGMSIPATPSLANYFAALHLQFGDEQNGFLPQNWQSHTKARITEILRCLSRTGLKMGGKLSDPKKVLAERLSLIGSTKFVKQAALQPMEAQMVILRTPPKASVTIS